MSALGEKLLFYLNQAVPNQHKSLLEAKSSPESYNSFFARRAASSFAQFGKIDLRDQHILDIGCGLGANLDFLIKAQASHITALDISEGQIKSTKNILNSALQKMQEKITFLAADAARLPFKDETFDAMVAADTFEHIDDLSTAMGELARVLKSGGHLYVYFPPFYAPWGAHMVNWITIPWCQVFFTEKTILNVARKLEKENIAINSILPSETRLDLGDGQLIPFVNHLTIKRFLDIVQSIPTWHIQMSRFLAPNWRSSRTAFKNVFNTINHVPWIREMFTAKAVFILRKQ
ncbi:MAG: class I SAM-dependent methyltransferase [Anaerolineaceae bacterium]|nr:class I SAM-dependent methyltransferase [Anaerolineaceae bacterium]